MDQQINIFLWGYFEIFDCHKFDFFCSNVSVAELNSWGESFEHLMNSESK